jgi:hypothetical protein
MAAVIRDGFKRLYAEDELPSEIIPSDLTDQATQGAPPEVTQQPGNGQWDQTRFFHVIRGSSPAAATIAHDILKWSEENMPTIAWGSGRTLGSFTPGLMGGETWHQVVSVWTNGVVELQFDYMRSKAPFHDMALRQELVDQFSRVPGFEMPEDAVRRRPSFELGLLATPEASDRFFETLNWFVSEVKAFYGQG